MAVCLSRNGTATLNDCTISSNTTALNGGGLVSGISTLNLTDCTVTGNSAPGDGGGLMGAGGGATLTACTISGNSAEYGGGVYELSEGTGTATFTDTIVAGILRPTTTTSMAMSPVPTI